MPDQRPPGPAAQEPPALAAGGAQCVVWESRYGPILIEVREGECFVNQRRVEPATPGLKG